MRAEILADEPVPFAALDAIALDLAAWATWHRVKVAALTMAIVWGRAT